MSAVMVLLHRCVALFPGASFTGVSSHGAFGPFARYRTGFLFPEVLSEHQIHGADFILNFSPKKKLEKVNVKRIALCKTTYEYLINVF